MLLRKDMQPQDYVTPQQINSLFSCWTREKPSAPQQLSSVSDDTYEDVVKGMKIILCSIYYCKMCKYFCLNEFLCFCMYQYLHVTNKGIFRLRMGCNI